MKLLWETLVLDVWDSNKIRIMGTLYSIPDFVSLFMVKRMQWSTVLHHVVVCVFNTFSLYNDYGKENVVRAIMIYAVFSTFAYLVNLLLASRFVQVQSWVSLVLSFLALLIYAACCSLNWTWHVFYLRRLFLIQPREEHWQIFGYICLVLLLVWDDLILMKWLATNVQRKWKKGAGEDGRGRGRGGGRGAVSSSANSSPSASNGSSREEEEEEDAAREGNRRAEAGGKGRASKKER